MRTSTLKPSSWAQAYTAAVLPTPVGPVMSSVLQSMSSASSSPSLLSPPNQDSTQAHSTGQEHTGLDTSIWFEPQERQCYLPLLSSPCFLSCCFLLSSRSARSFHSFIQLVIKMIKEHPWCTFPTVVYSIPQKKKSKKKKINQWSWTVQTCATS